MIALIGIGLLGACGDPDALSDRPPVVERLLDAPIITAEMDPTIGENIQGPSLIRAPGWIRRPLGRYYLYFADHKGSYIRLAYADELTGPWRVHQPGALHLADSRFLTEPPEVPEDAEAQIEERLRGAGVDPATLARDPLLDMTTPHVASPDVHVDAENQRIVMYFHGLSAFGRQETRVAVSSDGLRFETLPPTLGRSYFRVFRHGEYHYALAMPGQLYRSRTGLDDFEEGPLLFNPNMRHSAVLVRGDSLLVFWTQVGDEPERILLSRVDLTGPWESWQETEAVEVLRPERPWEGADVPLAPSRRSVALSRRNELRDPAIFKEDGDVYLLYSVAGESGIAIAELDFP